MSITEKDQKFAALVLKGLKDQKVDLINVMDWPTIQQIFGYKTERAAKDAWFHTRTKYYKLAAETTSGTSASASASSASTSSPGGSKAKGSPAASKNKQAATPTSARGRKRSNTLLSDAGSDDDSAMKKEDSETDGTPSKRARTNVVKTEDGDDDDNHDVKA